MLQGERSSRARTSLLLFVAPFLVFALAWLGEQLLAAALPATTLGTIHHAARVLMAALWAGGVLYGVGSIWTGEGYRLQAVTGILLNAAALVFVLLRAGSFF